MHGARVSSVTRSSVVVSTALVVAFASAVTFVEGASAAASGGPNGRIVFSSDRAPQGSHIYSVNPDGTELERLTNGPDDWDTSPAWSPNGGLIAFVSNRAWPWKNQIFTMDANGDHARQLTKNGWNTAPVWAPDGGAIAFESNRTGDPEVFVMNASGDAETNVSQHEGSDRDPSWSPDATKVAFLSTRDGDSDVFVVNADGTGVVNVSNNDVEDFSPQWSPDGTSIAFATWNGEDSDLFVGAPDGSGTTNLTQTTDLDESLPFWSPDGSQIAFQRQRVQPTITYLAVMDADGSNALDLTDWWPYDWQGARADWAPDGTRIVYETDGSVLAINPDGSDLTTVIGAPGDTTLSPDWQRLDVSISALPGEIPYGGSSTITAHLHWYETTTNLEVSIFATPVGGAKTLLASGTVDASGDLSVSVTPERNTVLSVGWSGDAFRPPAVSVPSTLGVRVLVRTRISGSYGTSGDWKLFHLGRPIRQTGIVVPNHAGKKLRFVAEKKVNGGWRVVASGAFKIRANGSATALFTPAQKGSYRVGNVFKGDTDHLGNGGPWRYVRVTS